MAQMALSDWKQWARERASWVGGIIEDSFWIVEQKWKDSVNMAAVVPASWDQEAEHRRGPDGHKRREGEIPTAKKAPTTGVHTVIASSVWAGTGPLLGAQTGFPENASSPN
jgi:hypothetical protein